MCLSVQVRKHVNDLYEDLRDGHNLISLLEVLSGDTLVRFLIRMQWFQFVTYTFALFVNSVYRLQAVSLIFSIIYDLIPKTQVVFLLVKYSTVNSVGECNLFSSFPVVSETSFLNRVMRYFFCSSFSLQFSVNKYLMLNIPSH